MAETVIKIKSDKIVVGETLFDGYLYVEGGKIAAITGEELPEAEESYDFTGSYVSPGFIDMHTHGAGGYPFLDCSVEDVVNGCNYHFMHGTTTLVPTISAAPFERMRRAVAMIDRAKKSGLAHGTILGAHMEGPYLSAKQCGAQCPDFITPPQKADYEKLMEELGESVTRWTYAPEVDPQGIFCRYLTDRSVVVSAGHTDAKYQDMLVALENGCNLITHLYSCTSTVTRDHGFRSLGVIETAFLQEDLYVEIIADGKHLPPELIRMIVKIKGTDKVALITDSLEIAGTDIRAGVMGGTEYLVEDGVCKLKDRSAFAGSVATADLLVRTLVKDCGFSIPTAVKMLTETPGRILKLNKGVLAMGKDADLVVFDEEIQVSHVFAGGQLCWEK